VPVRTEIVDQGEIEKTQSRSLADAVEWTNGVRVENDCQNCNFQQVRMLGLPGNFTQILADGRPSLSSLAAVYGAEHIPLALIDRIEIVKGGGSALYGPGAIAGVINVIPRTPTETGGYWKYGWDSMGGKPNHLFEGGADFVNKDGTQGITLFGQSTETSPVDLNSDGFTDVSWREAWSTGFRAFIEPTADSKLTIDYLLSNEDRRGGDRLDLPVTQALIAEAAQSELHMGGIRWEQEVNDRFDYELNLSGTYTQRDTYYGSGMDPNAFGNSESPVYYADLTGRYSINDQLKATVGVQYQYEKLEDEQPAYNRLTDETVRNTGVLSQLEWDFASKWNLVAGGRLDFNSAVEDPIFSPRLALKYNPIEDLAIRTAYSSGFRAPQVFDEDLHITQAGGTAQVIRNAPGLKEESSHSISLGAEWKPSFFDGSLPPIEGLFTRTTNSRPVTLEGNLFFTRLSDTFDLVETDDPLTPEQEFTRLNAADASVYGIELNLAWHIYQDLRFDLGMVEQRSRFDDPSGDFGSRNFDRTPDRYGVAGLTWDAPWCEVFIGAKYTGPMEVPHYAGFIPADRLGKSPSMVTWDLGLSRSFDLGDYELDVTAGVKNIFNTYQDDLDRGPDRDSAYVYGPRFPRQFNLSARISF
jgi:outer membrane receptor for ferrienterochelin and colicins